MCTTETPILFVPDVARLVDLPAQTADADEQRATMLLVVNTGHVVAHDLCQKLRRETLRLLVLPDDEQLGFSHGSSAIVGNLLTRESTRLGSSTRRSRRILWMVWRPERRQRTRRLR